MKKMVTLLLVSGLLAGPARADDTQDRVAASREVIKEFAETLKGYREEATRAGGAANGIEVCHVKAQEVAKDLSERTGWTIRRTSLKLRNPEKNMPDAWETQIMEAFAQRKQAGESIYAMDHEEVVETDGQKAFRYMKVIPMGGFCVNCHGKKVAKGVDGKLKALYPNDQARGFNVGDIRGAFSIVQPMP